MKSLKERAKEQYKGWKTPTKEAQSAFDRIMDKAAIDQGLEELTAVRDATRDVAFDAYAAACNAAAEAADAFAAAYESPKKGSLWIILTEQI